MASQYLCLHCMTGFLDSHGVCQRCGQPQIESNRIPEALPFGFPLYRGNYLLGSVLGHGGFGITYQAWDTRQRRRVAVKEFFPRNAVVRGAASYALSLDSRLKDDPHWVNYYERVKKSFYNEAETIYGLRNQPNILTIYDYFEELGTAYYSMEFLEGETLAGFAKRMGSVEWRQLAPIVWDVTEGLLVLHTRNLIHRDITPGNVFVLRNGRARLIDFGSVRDFEEAFQFTQIFTASLAAPEMFSGRSQGPWTDIFALCASLYFLLSGGKMPTHADTRLSDRGLSGADSLVPLEEYAPQTPPHVREAIQKGMALNIRDRLQDTREFRAAFFPDGPPSPPSKASSKPMTDLFCVSGYLTGQSFHIPAGVIIYLGRVKGSRKDWIPYPIDWKGVSRKQCAFCKDRQGNLFVKDLDSAFGTYLDGVKLQPGKWKKVTGQQRLTFGNEQFLIGT